MRSLSVWGSLPSSPPPFWRGHRCQPGWIFRANAAAPCRQTYCARSKARKPRHSGFPVRWGSSAGVTARWEASLSGFSFCICIEGVHFFSTTRVESKTLVRRGSVLCMHALLSVGRSQGLEPRIVGFAEHITSPLAAGARNRRRSGSAPTPASGVQVTSVHSVTSRLVLRLPSALCCNDPT